MRNSAIVVALYFLIFCTLSVNSQTCNVNASVAASNCLIGTGCSWTDPTIWACANFPNGLTYDVNLLGPGDYQINTNSDSITSLGLRSLTLGAGDAANFTTQVLSSSGISFQCTQPAVINSGGIWNADLQSGTFSGRLNINNGGQFNFISGSFTSSTLQININAGGQFSVTTSGSHSLGQTLFNYGNVTVVGTSLTLSNRAVLNNYGVLELRQGSSIGYTSSETIVNTGTIRISALTISNPSSIDTKLTSSGSLDIAPGASGTITASDSSIDNLTIADSSSFTFNANNLNIKNVINSGELTSSSGSMTIKSGGVLLNAGKWSINGGVSVNSPDNGVIRNIGTIFTSGSDLISFGASIYLLNGSIVPGGGPIYFKNLNLAGGKLDGPGDFIIRTFTWNDGEVHGSGTIEVNSTATISGTTSKILENKKLLFSSPVTSQISSSITGTGDITIGPSGVVNFGQGATISVPLVNNGRITGVATINGDFSNNGALGAAGNSATSNAVKLQVNGDLMLSSDSDVNIDLFSDTNDYGYLRCRQNAYLNGNLTIRAREGLYGSAGQSLVIVSGQTIIGSFSSIVLDQSQWSNPNKCTISSSFDQVKGVTVTFSECAGSGPGPTPTPPSTKLRTFAIVFVVIVLIIVAVGLIAKCQKKCRKRPWDRLTDDRY